MTTRKFKKYFESDLGKLVLQKEGEYIRGALGECGKILDVGCGNGFFEKELPDLNITGIDASEDMIEDARRRADNNFILGDAGDMIFDDEIFDAAFCVASLEFMDDYTRVVAEVHRVLKTGGKFLAMILNPESEYFIERFARKGSYFQRIKHRDLQKMRENISKLFKIEKREYILGIKEGRILSACGSKTAAIYVVTSEKTSGSGNSIKAGSLYS
jgi:ubiquinone/menaquinone biosynthesis C-methylase UbiE